MDIKQIWNQTLLGLTPKLSQITMDVWIKTLVPVAISNDKLILLAPLENCKNVVKMQYSSLIEQIVSEVSPFISGIEVICESDASALDNLQNITTTLSDNTSVSDNSLTETEQPFEERYTFDNFVVGDSNQIAVAAAKAVADNPGKQINPLFIYGGVGLGKTHIMHAIGNYIKSNNPDVNIIYSTTEKFTNDYIDSIAKSKNTDLTRQFREKYRNVDVLMLDDIQFISGKFGIQEVLFHTFNDLYQTSRQIIFTSDRHPKDLDNLEDRLKSRFQSGLTVDISNPGLETRIAILQRKAYQYKYNISKDVINYIAEKISTNIRELEGALSKVMFFCSLNGTSADNIDIVNKALKDEIDNKVGPITVDYIVKCVCSYFNVDIKDVIGKKKTKNIVEPRQIAVYLIADMMSIPLLAIGDYLGGRDHSTMIHARNKIEALVASDMKYRTYIKDIKDLIANSK